VIDSIPARFLDTARSRGSKPAYYVNDGGDRWKPTTWSTFAEEVRSAAKSLLAMGFQPGHTLCILGFNRPEWVILDHAAMLAGGAPAGIYTTCSPEEVQYIVDHSEARIVLVENHAQWQKIAAERERLPRLERVVLMRGVPEVDDELVDSWDAFLARGAEVPDAAVQERLEGLADDDVATFIYTSGTTGPPKAVMLTHRNLAWTASTAVSMTGITDSDSAVSYLPLSHIAEQMFTIHAPATAGYAIYYAESIERVPDNLRSVQPTIVFGVPRIWEKMHAKVSGRMAEATGMKRRLVDFAMRTGREVTALRNRGEAPSGLLALKYKLAERLIYSKVKPLMGLSRAHLCITGAAPISAEVLEFFAGLDQTIHEVYGQSEDCGPTTFNFPGRTRFGTVGQPLEGTEVEIADDGEIKVKGPHVFKGYYKDDAATAETLVDGWLHTGDLGAFDAEGFLRITGRKKEIIITAGGKNIAPKNIESALRDLPLVSQAVVIGDRRKFLSALITVDPEAVEAFADGRAGDELTEAVRAELERGIEEEVNPRFARVEHVRKFTVLPRDFSVDEGELTPTLKIKRRIVHEHFSEQIEAMYAGV
jgi:long-chain acyl-CoA synthetase